jgi:hypothetical protein
LIKTLLQSNLLLPNGWEWYPRIPNMKGKILLRMSDWKFKITLTYPWYARYWCLIYWTSTVLTLNFLVVLKVICKMHVKYIMHGQWRENCSRIWSSNEKKLWMVSILCVKELYSTCSLVDPDNLVPRKIVCIGKWSIRIIESNMISLHIFCSPQQLTGRWGIQINGV